jgi:predicted porin
MKPVSKLRGGWLLGAAAVMVGGWAMPAAAADLGGNCCSDLEERIAELEATTARKGNRKVSLTISGWVNEAVFWWDDGSKSNVYVGTNSVEQSRVRFVGEAKIDKDWSAGYTLELGTASPPSQQWNQASFQSANANPANQSGIIVRKSYWFLKNKQLGQVSIGQNGTATYHLLDDADFTLTRNVDDAEGAAIYQSAFQLRHNGVPIATGVGASPLRWVDVLRGFNNSTPGDSGRRSVVRYDSPAFAGFTGSAAWGENDLWDVALTYAGEIGDFKVLARAGYGQSNDPGTNNPSTGASAYVTGGTTCISSTSNVSSIPGFQCSWAGAGATIQHKPTGLFVFGGWGEQTIDTDNSDTKTKLVDTGSTTWFIQPGIEQKWLPLGKTTIFGEFRHDDPGSNPGSSATGVANGKTVGGSIDFWQGGIIQNIEAADTSVYLVYQHAGGYVVGGATTTSAGGAPSGKTSIDGFQEVVGGLKINF